MNNSSPTTNSKAATKVSLGTNQLLEQTQIWKIVLLLIVANTFNYAVGLALKSVFHFSGSVGSELATGLLFAIQIVWFVWLFARNGVSIRPELMRLRGDIDLKETTAVLVFNYAVSIGMVLALLLAILKLLPAEFVGSMTESTAQSTEFVGALIGLITTSVLAPIAEELVFRGVLLTRLKSRFGTKTAILISSALFGLTHLSLAMVRAALFGACMCILYLRTENILVPIVIHMVYNFLLTIAGSYPVLFGLSVKANTSLALNTTTTLLEIAACVIVALASGIYLAKRFDFFNIESLNAAKQKEP